MPDVLSPADTTVGSGAFNRKITIQKLVATADAMGGGVRNWADYIKTWAHIEPYKGVEKIIAQQTYASNISQFLIRYRPSQNIDASMRILYRSRIYNIRNIIQPSEAHTTIKILAEEQQAQGSL
jgi:SPP1 family predicted phage head-tail adaptor